MFRLYPKGTLPEWVSCGACARKGIVDSRTQMRKLFTTHSLVIVGLSDFAWQSEVRGCFPRKVPKSRNCPKFTSRPDWFVLTSEVFGSSLTLKNLSKDFGSLPNFLRRDLDYPFKISCSSFPLTASERSNVGNSLSEDKPKCCKNSGVVI